MQDHALGYLLRVFFFFFFFGRLPIFSLFLLGVMGVFSSFFFFFFPNSGNPCVTAEYQQCLVAWDHIRRMAQAPEIIIDINIAEW